MEIGRPFVWVSPGMADGVAWPGWVLVLSSRHWTWFCPLPCKDNSEEPGGRASVATLHFLSPSSCLSFSREAREERE